MQAGRRDSSHSSGGLVQSARMDHCHFDNLEWEAMFRLAGWLYGVDDHNLFECVAQLSIRTESARCME